MHNGGIQDFNRDNVPTGVESIENANCFDDSRQRSSDQQIGRTGPNGSRISRACTTSEYGSVLPLFFRSGLQHGISGYVGQWSNSETGGVLSSGGIAQTEKETIGNGQSIDKKEEGRDSTGSLSSSDKAELDLMNMCDTDTETDDEFNKCTDSDFIDLLKEQYKIDPWISQSEFDKMINDYNYIKSGWFKNSNDNPCSMCKNDANCPCDKLF